MFAEQETKSRQIKLHIAKPPNRRKEAKRLRIRFHHTTFKYSNRTKTNSLWFPFYYTTNRDLRKLTKQTEKKTEESAFHTKKKKRRFSSVSSEKIRKTKRAVFPIVKKGKCMALHKNDEIIRWFPRVIHIFHRVFHWIGPKHPVFFVKMWKTSFVLPIFHMRPVEN